MAPTQSSRVTRLRPAVQTTQASRAGLRKVTSEELPQLTREELPSDLRRLAGYFESVFFTTPRRVAFKPQWKNDTDHLDHIVDDTQLAQELELGERATFVDDNGRRAIVINTPMGCACVFERYTDQPWTLAQNAPHELILAGVLESSGGLDEERLRTFFLLGGLLSHINSQMAAE